MGCTVSKTGAINFICARLPKYIFNIAGVFVHPKIRDKLSELGTSQILL